MPRFSDEEIRRYARQMVLPEVGGVGQERLRDGHAEAQDEVEALYLAGAGIGRLTVPNQEIADAVRALNPLVQVTVASTRCEGRDVAAQSLRALAILRETLGL
jgi:adenylyltransferase/sulfurtransferase